jgi:hypothetical protein
VEIWAKLATIAQNSPDQGVAIEAWQALLGDQFFPATVT